MCEARSYDAIGYPDKKFKEEFYVDYRRSVKADRRRRGDMGESESYEESI